MQEDIFRFNGEALGSVSHLVLLLVIASLVIALLIRLGIAIFAPNRVEEHNRVTPQIPTGHKRFAGSAEPNTRSESQRERAPELLQATVMRYFERLEECNPEPKSESPEEKTIRTQKEHAAELFRSFKVERAASIQAELANQVDPCQPSPNCDMRDVRDSSELLSSRLQSICIEHDCQRG